MKIEISSMSAEDLRFFIKWATDKRNHYDNLLNELEDALQKQGQVQLPFAGESSKQESKNGYKPGNRTIDKIIQVMSAHGSWLKNGEIRELLKAKIGLDLSSNGLRTHLQKNEGHYFQRKGENKETRWRTIVEVPQ